MVRAVLSSVAATAMVLVAASGSSAHSELIDASPADGEQLSEPVVAVELTFNEDIEQIGADVVVTGTDGVDITAGEPVIDGTTLTQEVSTDSQSGELTVQWRVVSADGHPVSGEYTFGIEGDGSAVGEEVDPTEDATDDGSGVSEDAAATDDAAGGSDDTQGAASDDGPLAEDLPGGAAPWGAVFALALAGLVIVLVIRARRQLQERVQDEQRRDFGDPEQPPPADE